MKNGFFQLIQQSTGTGLRIVKAVDGGDEVRINEVMEYLNTQGIVHDLLNVSKGVHAALQSEAGETVVALNQGPCRAVEESYKLMASPDQMIATIRLYPPSSGGTRLSADQFRRELRERKIKNGIRESVIEEIFKNPVYCTDYVVAEGTRPRQGADMKVEYFFNTDLSSIPTLKEDGSVDFFNLNNINHCTKGQLLARLTPADRGETGFNIFGEMIKPREVKKIALKQTNHVILSEDKLSLFSQVDGHVMLVEGNVFVSNVLTVENVNSATGNIEFEGSVVVLGNVFTNFVVKAHGNIEVKGVVEGAVVESGGDIIIARGVKGMGKGWIKAGGNVISQFLENAKVEAAGYVSADLILHSEVVAGTEINVGSKRGFITGGKVCAGNQIRVRNLGSEMGSDTIVEVGMDPTLKIRIQKLQKKIAELGRDIKAAKPVLTAMATKIAQGVRLQPDQIKHVQKLSVDNKQKMAEMEAAMAELDELENIRDDSDGAQVIVSGDVYVGTQVCIGDVSMTVKTRMSYCRFVKEQGEVRISGI